MVQRKHCIGIRGLFSDRIPVVLKRSPKGAVLVCRTAESSSTAGHDLRVKACKIDQLHRDRTGRAPFPRRKLLNFRRAMVQLSKRQQCVKVKGRERVRLCPFDGWR